MVEETNEYACKPPSAGNPLVHFPIRGQALTEEHRLEECEKSILPTLLYDQPREIHIYHTIRKGNHMRKLDYFSEHQQGSNPIISYVLTSTGKYIY